MAKLEIACFNFESAIITYEAGADRIELCVNREVGGTTPPKELFVELKNQIDIPIYVMIRPRGGNFVYSEQEFELMKADLQLYKSLGASGFVFGILTANHEINFQQNSELFGLAQPLPCTFHKAFDEIENQNEALETCVAIGFQNILTSGGVQTVQEGLQKIINLTDQAQNRINILPGGGIRSSNIKNIKSLLKNDYFHSAGIISGEFACFNEIEKLKQLIV